MGNLDTSTNTHNSASPVHCEDTRGHGPIGGREVILASSHCSDQCGKVFYRNTGQSQFIEYLEPAALCTQAPSLAGTVVVVLEESKGGLCQILEIMLAGKHKDFERFRLDASLDAR